MKVDTTKGEGAIEFAAGCGFTEDQPLGSAKNIDELAETLRVGRTKLFLAFREKLGITPVVYLRRARVERVKQLLMRE